MNGDALDDEVSGCLGSIFLGFLTMVALVLIVGFVVWVVTLA